MDGRIVLVKERITVVEEELAKWRKNNSISCPNGHKEYSALKQQLEELKKVLDALTKK